MSLAAFTQRVEQVVAEKASLEATLKFQFDEGVVHIDGTQEPGVVSNEDAGADCTISMELGDAIAFLDGELNAVTAFMEGKMKVEGNMAIAMKVVQLFS
jgi:putative sterol carrier protein